MIKVPFVKSHYNYSMRRLLSCGNICVAANQNDQEATDAGTVCSEKLELCSVSFVLTKKPVDVTATADSDDNNDIPLPEPGVVEPAAMEINAKAALAEAQGDLYVAVCLTNRLSFCILLPLSH